ncbi:MAG: RNA polymerase factor sigma-54 [Pirellulaceae bacterium]|nr:RNA polymerase factor sigma-54 [Pirellulaceae bacterium]
MRLSFGLEQKLAQKQVMAPRMIQSMEILQLPLQALQERIEQELGENPILDIKEEMVAETTHDKVSPDAPTESEKELVVKDDSTNADDFERLANMGDQIPERQEEQTRLSSSRIQDEQDRQHDTMANATAREESLYDVLDHQLGEIDLGKELNDACERIISSLDSKGYLKGRLEDLVPPGMGDEGVKLAEKALQIVQSLEPVGVGARDLKECLLLQLETDDLFYDEMKVLIENHLEDLRDNRLPLIKQKTGYSIETIKEAWHDMRQLDPFPGLRYSESVVRAIKPDFWLEVDDETGEFVVKLEDRELPQLYISNYYRQRLQDKTATTSEKEFIRKKITSAQWLIDSIIQRRTTLLNVAQAIVKVQKAFILEGPEAIVPLKMQQIADEVGVHVTTVSRAVDEKYIQTPRGIFPLREFFVGGTQTADGEDVAWDKIRLKLQELVDEEDKKKPHSDDELVKRLKVCGLSVARRTVTKYRKKMGIPSSRGRREWD